MIRQLHPSRNGLLSLAALCALTAWSSGDARTVRVDAIQRVAWMTGCWETSNPRRTIEEHWFAPRGGIMLGSGRTMRGDSLVEFEVVLIRQQGEKLAYEAHPSGQATATFMSTTLTDSSVVFENLQHDFPTHVAYERRGADSLMAWVSGPRGGTTRRIEFPYRRVSCT